MNYHEDCRCCGHRITAYTLPLNKGLARSFLKFADAYIRGGSIALEKGALGLTNSEYGNFPNLRYFGLIDQVEKGKSWIMTPKGFAFLHGGWVLSPVAHFDGIALPDDHLAWATHDGPRKLVALRDILPAEWKQRTEYQAEKRDSV